MNFQLDHFYLTLNQIGVHGSIVGSIRDTEVKNRINNIFFKKKEMLRFSTDHNVYPIVETY